MPLPELLVAVAGLAWLALLFGIAIYGERHPGVLARHWGIVYALSLGVHCTSWTFYGTVTQAERSGWWLPPTFVGLILLYFVAAPVLVRLVRLAREHHASSLADLVAARLGRNAGLAALVTAVTVIGIVPYIALQLKAVAMSYSLFRGAGNLAAPAWQDSALWVALAMALFAMLFGTRRAPAAAHNRGLVLALAFESLFKLVALLAIGVFVLRLPDLAAAAHTQPRDSSGFAPLILLGALAAFTLPHQFHAGVVECRDARHVRTARWLFPLYLVLIALPVLPLALAGAARLGASGVSSDLYVLALPLAQGQNGLAVLGFLGGLSAATSMVIVATLALSLMIGNHWIAPLRVRTGWGRGDRGDLRPSVLRQRRIAILAVVLLAWAYSRVLAGSDALADIGALSFSALAGLMPAVLVALYRPGIGARAVALGLVAGSLTWLYALAPTLLPGVHALQGEGPLGIVPLAPRTLFGLGAWSELARALCASLAVNIGVLALAARTRWARAGAMHPRASSCAPSSPHSPSASCRASASWRCSATARARGCASGRRGRARTRRGDRRLLRALLLEVARRERHGQLDTVAAIVGEASQDLRFNQRVLEAALENMSQGICVVDANLDVVAWNRRYEELFAYPPGLLAIGRPIAELTRHNIARGLIGSGGIDERVERRMRQMRAGTPHLAERTFPDGTVLEIRGNPMPGGGFVATFTDVTAFRQAERALTRANETLEQRVAARTTELARASAEAERANQAKTRFLAAVSHDLAQPLHAAHLFTHALAQGMDAEGRRATVAHIDGALSSAEALLGGLLDISRLDAGGMPMQRRHFAADEVLGGLAAEFGALADAKGLSLRYVPTRAWLHSDPQLLRRVLQNFLSNALKYTRRGRILFGCRRRGGRLRIEVWDSGEGIAEADLGVIFEEFRRLDRGGAGLGLGLAIAERIARLLEAPLTLRSWPGDGSVFTIELPRVAALAHALVEPVDAELSTPRRRVLVVDNDAAVLAATQALLAGWNCEVLAASDLDSARALCARLQPHMLLLDHHLDGGMTGLELRARLGDDIAALPCIVITADHGEEVRRAVLAAGCHLLHKPLKPLALKSLMARLLM